MRRLWAYRLLAMTLIPGLFFGLLEGGLRVFGYGYPTSFFVEIDGREAYTTNQKFGWQFFPPAITRTPVVCELSADKASDTYRIFVLGGSAALGTPDESYSFGRVLEVMLQDAYPGARFEVVNAAMTAINSQVVLPIARDCARRQPDLFVVYMGNNEVVGPYGAGTVFKGYSPSLAAIRAGVWVRSTRIGQLLERLVQKLPGGEGPPGAWQGMAMFLSHRVAADDPRLEGVYSHFRENLSDVVEVGIGSGAKVILSTVGTNLKDSAPFASVPRAGLTEAEASTWERAHREGAALAEAGEHAAAVEKFAEALEVDGRYAEVHFRLGRSHGALGRLERARTHYVRARDLDALRFRADSEINRVIREVAEGREAEGVYLVDAEGALESNAEGSHGLPGKELFYDHVHLNLDGNYLLAKTVLERVKAVLPPWVQDRSSGPVGPTSRDRCAELLALTGWDRGRLYEKMAEMMEAPPFTHQFDHERQRAFRRQHLARLKEEHLSQAAFEEARTVYLRALERDPEDLGIRVNLASLLEKLEDYEAAADHLRTLLQRVPGTAAWHSQLGDILSAQGRHADAVAEYREASRIVPRLASPHVRTGRTFARMGKFPDAITELRRALEINPGSAEASLILASSLEEQGSLEEAAEAYRRTLQIDPGNVVAHIKLGRTLRTQGDLVGAGEQYRQLLQIDPTLSTAHYGLALALVKQGKTVEAVEHYREALRLTPDWPPALSDLAWILATHRRAEIRNGEEAVLLAERACQLSAYRVPLFLDTLAAAYAEVARFDEAVSIATKARELAAAEGEDELGRIIEARLESYRAAKPFHGF